MPIELECKVRVSSLEAVRETLRAAGAEYVGRVLETNRLFDRDDGSLRAAGRGLRIRSVEILHGRGPAPTLTYKGPRTRSPFKRREEIEIGIDDPGAMTNVLHALGYAEDVVFEKRRESWSLGPCSIELDELPRLGTFVEVEGPDEQAIHAALAALELSDGESITQGYAAMVAAYCKGAASQPITVRFE